MRSRAMLLAVLFVAAACADDDEEVPGGFDGALPEFADAADGGDPLVAEGDIAQRPAQATTASLAVSGVSIDLVGAVCVATDLDLPGGFAFQAAIPSRDGKLSVELEPRSGQAEIELFLDGELIPGAAPTVQFEDGIWQIESDAGDPDGAAPAVIVTFACPGPLEERLQGGERTPDVTPDPGQVNQ